ncbi:MAG: PolC-type DNA polymerase III [Lachnospiraceae bacterium]|nr:PolC-type DNA polymerase III [Lachnospiraceae bacterium]
MGRKFAEVFPSIQLKEEYTLVMEQVTVEKIVMTKTRERLKVYITCNNLIEKRILHQIEKQIENQLSDQLTGGSSKTEVVFYETYHLSGQYDVQTLFERYLDSMIYELKEYSPILGVMLAKAEISFPAPGEVTISCEENELYKQKEKELTRILEKIVCERCGLKGEFFFQYHEPKENVTAKEREAMMARKAALISAVAAGGSQGEVNEAAADTLWNGDDNNGLHNAATNAGEGKAKQGTTGDGLHNDNKSAEKSAQEPVADKAQSSLHNSPQPPKRPEKKFEKGGFRRNGGFGRGFKGDDPDLIMGFNTDGEIVRMDQLEDGIGNVVIHGQIWGIEEGRSFEKSQKTIVTFYITDFTDSLKCKVFCPDEELSGFLGTLKNGSFYLLSGNVSYDIYDRELEMMVKAIKKSADWRTVREDHSIKKRVELHCHTKCSEMDGVSEAKDIVMRAYKWGHPAIAITDHGGVQALADVYHEAYGEIIKMEKDKAEAAGEVFDRQKAFKIIIGCEIYLVDDTMDVVVDSKGQSLLDSFVVFDIETTGFSAEKNNIIEIGAVKVEGGVITDRFSSYVNPREPIPMRIQTLTTISDETVKDAPYIEEVLPKFMDFCKGSILVAHNARFDIGFIKENCRRQEIPFDYTWLDTLQIARVLMPKLAKFTLDNVAKNLKIVLLQHHRAVDDAECTAKIFEKFISMLQERKVYDLDGLNEFTRSSDDMIRKMPTYHCIVLAKNDTGRCNLYRLISASNLRFFNRRPRIPKTMLTELREGLIIGSACEAGELFRAIVDGRSSTEISSIASFYDYLEIQPIGNNAFMIDDDKFEDVHNEEDLKELNRKIVSLGKQLKKPVCATCDVHFLNPEDEIYRRIIMAGKGFDDADNQAPLYLRTTEEMLEEFSYLGMDTAREVVIDNPNLISDMVDVVEAARPDKCPPVIPDSDTILRKICHQRAVEIYGEDLPQIVKDRMEKELDSIISNGFAVMYIIAQKLVWKSVEDGYLVGSRGSVGSSFVAFLAGITEVNSLSAHYLCPSCHYVDFDSEEVRSFSGMAGCDMPDKICPVCGKPLSKEGFDIPFETFLGFKGDKEPDIDLNFSNEYQSKAHKYTEVIFGDGQTFKAGTIGTLADKTAAGYVRKYYEEHGVIKRRCEVERIAIGCTGILRSTGQHPGGIVVLPLGEDINSFTPVQHPANDMTSNIVTTHFDYHKIDHNLLKLDILGHLDPTMIRMLQDLTGVDPVTIPLDDKKVMSLFQDLSALGLSPEDLDGCTLGARGIPEFGTENAINMLKDTKPQSFTDLVRISGLSHGEGIWEGNAKKLISEGTTTISKAICTRDDIMIYLIDMGLDSSEAFDIMENVRKGKVAKGKCGKWGQWKEDMAAHGVPDWYIWSCEQIKYMFPKAHAAAYVMMAWRVGYCKVYYPLAYYTAYFSIRAKAFNYELMCLGKAKANQELENLKKKKKELMKKKEKLQAKDDDTISDLLLVQEMYARGIEFAPIDIYKAHSRRFQIIDGKIMPALSAIEGMGAAAAEQFMEGARAGTFISIDDLKTRTKVPTNVLEKMKQLGLLEGLPESNQLSLFDMLG